MTPRIEPSTRAGTWLFQAVPKRYNLEEELHAGRTETWLVTRFAREIEKGDLVFLWMAGSPEVRGLYGWGRVVDDGPRFYKDWGNGVAVRYEKRFPTHIPASEVRSLGSFADHVLFKTAIGTNFRLTAAQRDELGELAIRKFGKAFSP
jgi:hypothetical protein